MHLSTDPHLKTARSSNVALPGIAIFLAGALAFGLWQKTAQDGKYATFVKHCENLSTNDRFALRTPDGRIILINFLEIPKSYLATFCGGPTSEPKTPRRLDE